MVHLTLSMAFRLSPILRSSVVSISRIIVLHGVDPVIRGGLGLDPLQQALVLLLALADLDDSPPRASFLLLCLDLLLPLVPQHDVHPVSF